MRLNNINVWGRGLGRFLGGDLHHFGGVLVSYLVGVVDPNSVAVLKSGLNTILYHMKGQDLVENRPSPMNVTLDIADSDRGVSHHRLDRV